MKQMKQIEGQSSPWIFFMSDLKNDVKTIAEQVRELEKSYGGLANKIEVIVVRQEHLIQKVDELVTTVSELKTIDVKHTTTVQNIKWFGKPAYWMALLAFFVFADFASNASTSQDHDRRLQELESAVQKVK